MTTGERGGWHCDTAVLQQWANGSGSSAQEASIAASVEQHLVNCDDCRQRLNDLVAQQQPQLLPDLEPVWAAISTRIETPSASWVERLLVRFGLSESDALLVAAAPSLRGAWLLAIGAVVAFAVIAASTRSSTGTSVFLLVAPLVPLAAVALAYSPETDAAFEQESATPYPSARLLLLRVLAVLAGTVPFLAAGSLLLPDRTALLWLLPAASFSLVGLAASTWAAAGRVVAGVALVWVLGCGVATRTGSPDAVVAPVSLSLLAALGLVSLLVFTARRTRLGEVH